MSQGHFVPQKFHTDWVRTETGPLMVRNGETNRLSQGIIIIIIIIITT
jgi:hypothetical protein